MMPFETLRQIEERSQSIAQALADPGAASRPDYARLRKEHAETTEVVARFGEYREVLRQLADARLLAQNPDRELQELALAEVGALEERQAALEEELRRLLLPKDPNDDRNVFLEIRAGA